MKWSIKFSPSIILQNKTSSFPILNPLPPITETSTSKQKSSSSKNSFNLSKSSNSPSSTGPLPTTPALLDPNYSFMDTCKSSKLGTSYFNFRVYYESSFNKKNYFFGKTRIFIPKTDIYELNKQKALLVFPDVI